MVALQCRQLARTMIKKPYGFGFLALLLLPNTFTWKSHRLMNVKDQHHDVLKTIRVRLRAWDIRQVWDIQNTTGGDTISIVLKDSVGRQKELSGHADFIISSQSAKCQGSAFQNALCVVEIQSKDDEDACEYQIKTYLVLMMNRFGFIRLAGILVCNDGTFRSYRASRALNGGATGNGAVYEQNDKFDLYQIDEILPVLFSF